MPEMRPSAGSAMVLNAVGEKSRSVMAHASQRSVRATVTDFPSTRYFVRSGTESDVIKKTYRWL